jgi:hypothetical protein
MGPRYFLASATRCAAENLAELAHSSYLGFGTLRLHISLTLCF